MLFNKLIKAPVGADYELYRNTRGRVNGRRTPVGPDLSRPPPIYRPRWMFRYLAYFVKSHKSPGVGDARRSPIYRTSTMSQAIPGPNPSRERPQYTSRWW